MKRSLIGTMRLDAFICVSGFDRAWDSLIKPWLLRSTQTFLTSKKPIVFVAPNKHILAFVQSRAAKEGITTLGVHWMTPGRLSKAFFAEEGLIANREDIRICLSLVLEEHRSSLAQSISREPKAFLSAYDAYLSSGHSVGDFFEEDLAFIAQKLTDKLGQLGLSLIQQSSCERQVDALVFQDLFIYGFHASHWPWMRLLQQSSRSCESLSVCLWDAGDQKAQHAWIGSWEESLKEPIEQQVSIANEGLFNDFARCLRDSSVFLEPKRDYIGFELYDSAFSEAQGILLQLRKWMDSNFDGRIAVVFGSQTSVVARHLALLLKMHKIEHYDSIGHNKVSSLSVDWVLAWASYQEERSIDSFYTLLYKLRELEVLNAKELKRIKRKVSQASIDVRTQDISVILRYLSTTFPKVQDFIELLPVSSSFKSYFNRLLELVDLSNAGALRDICISRGHYFSRHNVHCRYFTFLAWLKSMVIDAGRVRYDAGSHVFSKIQLLTPESAVSQSWSHVILAEVNQGNWFSKVKDSLFIPEAKMLQINESFIYQGWQGEGHQALANERSYVVNQGEFLKLKEAITLSIIESVSQGLFISGSQESSRVGYLSDWAIRLYWSFSGELLRQDNITKIISSTDLCVDNSLSVSAYLARRDELRLYPEYEYGMGCSVKGKGISCKNWEGLMQRPDESWYKSILGVEVSDLELTPLLSLGTWVHDWVEIDHEDSHPIKVPEFSEWYASSSEKFNLLQNRVNAAYLGKTPDVWSELFKRAVVALYDILKTLSSQSSSWPYMLSEWEMNPAALRDIPISVHGRIDLVLLQGDSMSGAPARAKVVDIKTALKKKWTAKDLSQGQGLQVFLYALGLENENMLVDEVSLVGSGALAEQAITLKSIPSKEAVLESMSQAIQNKCLGASSATQYERARKPLAILPVDEVIQVKKNMLNSLP